jgi:hypothetical protein
MPALKRRTPGLRFPLLAVATAGVLSCSNAGEDLGFGPLGSGTVAAFIYVDRDGDLNPSAAADTAFAGVRLGLVVAGTPDTIFSATTDALGSVVFSNVPFGNYRFIVDTTTVGDSLDVQAIDSVNVRLSAAVQQQFVTIRLGFPLLTIAQARTEVVGRRVFVVGQVLAGLGVFGDSTAHVMENGVAIRLTSGINSGPASQPGDSVRVLGTVSVSSGQPVLDDAAITVFRLGFSSPPGTPLSTMLAANADTAAQDAALVRVTSATIVDTATVGNDFEVGIDDGSGRVVMVLDGDGSFQTDLFIPGDTVTGDGVLVPTGTGTWVIKPRTPSDVTIS